MRRYKPIPQFTQPELDRFWERVEVHQPAGCWQWRGQVRKSDGYAVAHFHRLGTFQAYRVSYSLLIGPIPEGMTLDHLCRNRSCVNPDHLQVIDSVTNALRGYGTSAMNKRRTHCIYGHPFTPENTYVTPGRHRMRTCRICAKRRSAATTRKITEANRARREAALNGEDVRHAA